MDDGSAGYERRSTVGVLPPLVPRKLNKVPFVEMADGRLQGVVSSGSDIARVYVSAISAETHGYSCSTNNNRPCGGLGGYGSCKHIESMTSEAITQYGIAEVARFLKIDVAADATRAWDVLHGLNGQQEKLPAGVVFARFLAHLSYLEVPSTTEAVPEMQWFPSTGVK